tara:strand:- start:38 stop:814 length:777 start_codon:yes stop_codon:yes gene_type:complete
MLLNSVIFILREVLEASLIISVFLALSQNRSLSKTWSIPAVLLGLGFAALYASQITAISHAFDGVGQEVTNAGLHLLIYIFMVSTIVLLKYTGRRQFAIFTMMACVVFASIREGSELIMYLSGFVTAPELFSSVMLGSAIGAGIGVSLGVFFYYSIASMRLNLGLLFGLILLVFIAGGMVSQAVQLLTQADFISSQSAIWNSTFLVDEQSLIGQLLYALIGYESTPTLVQFIAYSLSLVVGAVLAMRTFLSSMVSETP